MAGIGPTPTTRKQKQHHSQDNPQVGTALMQSPCSISYRTQTSSTVPIPASTSFRQICLRIRNSIPSVAGHCTGPPQTASILKNTNKRGPVIAKTALSLCTLHGAPGTASDTWTAGYIPSSTFIWTHLAKGSNISSTTELRITPSPNQPVVGVK